MQKTLFLITGLGYGGAERFLLKLLPLLDKSRVVVVSVTGLNDIGAELESEGVRVVYLNSGKSFKFFRSILGLRRVIKEFRPTVMMTFLIHADLFGRFFGRLFGVKKVICNIRNDYSKINNLWKLDRLTRFMVSSYVINSPSLKSYMKRIKVSNYSIISNGIDLDYMDSIKPVSLDVSGKKLVTVSRLEKQKDIGTLIKSLKYLDDYSLVIVGDGSQKRQLRELSSSLGLSDRVHFLGYREDAVSVMKNCDIFVLPSITEGMSNSLLEAMSIGLPCLVSNIKQNRVLIKDGENGLTFSLSNPKDLSKKIKLIEQADTEKTESENNKKSLTKNKYGKAAKQTIKNNYNLDSVKKDYERLLR